MITCTTYSCQVTAAKTVQKLSKSAVATRALQLADAEGLETLTIRKLATDLGVTPMALYWHFRSKDELLGGLVDRVWSEIDIDIDRGAPWPRQLRTLLESLVKVLRAHPAASKLLLEFDAQTEASMGPTEVTLEILRDAGFDPEMAAIVARLTLWNGIMLVMSEPDSEFLEDEERDRFTRTKQAMLLSLPPAAFPRVIESAVPLTMCADPEAHYELGMTLFVAGVEALAARRQGRQSQ